MLHQIWLRVKRFQPLFEFHPKPNQELPLGTKALLPPLNELDLEFLFRQLLEGVYRGKSQSWANKWLLDLENRVTTERWVAWLNSFGEKLLASPSNHTELAAKMIQLGESGCGEIGKAAHRIGTELLKMQQKQSSLPYKNTKINLTTTVDLKSWQTPLEKELQAMLQEDLWLVSQAVESHPSNAALAAISKQSIELKQTHSHQPIALLKPSLEPYSPQELPRVKSPESWNNQGTVFKKLGELEQAIASFEQAIMLKPNYHQAWYNRGIVLFEQALKFQQDWEDFRLGLFNVGCLNESLSSFGKALEIKPDYQQAQSSRDQILSYYQKVKIPNA
jgi:tetratricopeptide (TPR) repeat protein